MAVCSVARRAEPWVREREGAFPVPYGAHSAATCVRAEDSATSRSRCAALCVRAQLVGLVTSAFSGSSRLYKGFRFGISNSCCYLTGGTSFLSRGGQAVIRSGVREHWLPSPKRLLEPGVLPAAAWACW